MEALEKVRVLATGGQDQFGAAHRATCTDARAPSPPPAPTGAPSGTTQGKQLDEYFDALAPATSTDQSMLAELVAPNTCLTKANELLTKTNESLVAKLAKSGGQ